MVDPQVTLVERVLRDWRVYVVLAVGLLLAPIVLVAALLWLEWLQPVLASQFWLSIIVMGLNLFVILHLVAALILAERKFAAWMQDRPGPNRVGFWGLLQPIADGAKFLLKEDITPANVDKPTFILAPFLAVAIALINIAVIPWAGSVRWPWMDADAAPLHTQVANLDVGFLFMLAIGSLSVYGVVLAGWASNNKYSFYGGMRATAQMLSYEVPLGLGLLCVLLVSGSLRLDVIVDQQAATGVWNVFLHPIAFLLVLVSAFAETNRTPFDLAEAEQELVGGYHTEYSAMKFACFFLAEYAHMTINSALLVVLFFGGWAPLPWMNFGLTADNTAWWAMLLKYGILWGKVLAVLGLYIVIRWTIPRFRFDQLMRLAWKGLVPAGIAIVMLTAVLVVFNLNRSLPASLAANAAVIVLCLVIAAVSKTPVTGRQDNLPDVDARSRRAAMEM